MLILGIETSCDETAAALVAGGREILSSVVATQLDLHSRYGGVVPEIAARRHAELIGYVIDQAIVSAGRTLGDVEAVAVTARQGLVGCLLVGAAAAKTLSYARRIPLVGIHHIEGHVFANLLSNPTLPVPHVCLTVSGGHTMLLLVEAPCRYRVLGVTLDDAAGEAFDKVAKFLGLGFPGGPAIEKAAREGNGRAFRFPRPLLRAGNLDFSFSGLKTAVINAVRPLMTGGKPLPVADIAASFQEAAVEVLVSKTLRVALETGVKAVSVTGGVSANRRLRQAFTQACQNKGLEAFFPDLSLCTDNGAMVAAAGYARLNRGEVAGLDLDVVPSALMEL
ncbi:MAG: tRNA (adenosine(37)-N6)-threonylcarbamoyltransferase complex transferase subunit TsaD [Chloroflexi bacterium]|nr:tRNA (adenosine(37)-N6)-threonylcarbamoyltransferase complex transferase subunit TsaD [Chloroflexota bacterium]